MSTIPFTLLNDGKRFSYSYTQEPGLLELFHVGAQGPKLLELFPGGAHEPQIFEPFHEPQEPRLLQLFPVDGEPAAAIDETQGSNGLVGASEPELPEIPGKHHSQPPTSLVLAQRPGNSLASDRSVHVMLSSLVRELRTLSLAGNEREGFPSRIHNSMPKLAEHTIHPAPENVNKVAAPAQSICIPHPTREVTIGPVTAYQSGSSPIGRGLADIRPVLIQELMSRRAAHLSKRQPEREDSANISLPANIENVNKGQLAAQESLTLASVNPTSSVGEHLVNMRPPTRVELVLENAKNLIKFATTALPHPARWLNINPVAAHQSQSSLTSWGLTKKRRLAVQESFPTRSENVGRRQPERDDLANGSLQARREHVWQRLPSNILPLKKRRLAIQEPLPSRQASVNRQLGNITQPARGEPLLEHGNGKPPTGGELVMGHVNIGSAPGQHNLQTRSSVGNRAGPQRWHKSPETPTGREPILGSVNIRASAGQQPGKSSSVRGGGRGPHKNRGSSTMEEPVLALVDIMTPAGQQAEATRSSRGSRARPGGPHAASSNHTEGESFVGHDVSIRSSAKTSGARSRRPLAGKIPAYRTYPAMRGGPPRRKSSSYKGVTHYLRTGRWEANIWNDRKQRYLGASATEIQAARAYDRALIHFKGVEAKLNFILDDYAGELGQLSNVKSDDLISILRKQSKGHGEPMPDYTYRRQSFFRCTKIPKPKNA